MAMRNHQPHRQFLDLPPEVREEIYFHAVEIPDKPCNLCNMSAPALAWVTKQTRRETIRVFTTRCSFVVVVYSNYSNTHRLDNFAAHPAGLPELHEPGPWSTMTTVANARMSGICKPMTQSTQAWLFHWAGSQPLHFRNIKLLIFDPSLPSFEPALWLRTQSGVLLFQYENVPGLAQFPELDNVRDTAVVVAQNITASNKIHKGFSLQELDIVAKAFLYWPGPVDWYPQPEDLQL